MRRTEGKDGYDVQIMEDILCDPRWSKRSLDNFVLETFGDNIILPADFSAHTSVKRNNRSNHTL
jgi:hypothetical protein